MAMHRVLGESISERFILPLFQVERNKWVTERSAAETAQGDC
jgi:hypothetical protein